ncbi:unnamed protein product [Haemonchus placei]|uniref:Uncharacterized protein n=1 Tax=Haemonchus placei TaxID=6290 RepID=A0A0N4WZD9_HAEPC|nr:unnamed protein product [Haemonchus placei]
MTSSLGPGTMFICNKGLSSTLQLAGSLNAGKIASGWKKTSERKISEH